MIALLKPVFLGGTYPYPLVAVEEKRKLFVQFAADHIAIDKLNAELRGSIATDYRMTNGSLPFNFATLERIAQKRFDYHAITAHFDAESVKSLTIASGQTSTFSDHAYELEGHVLFGEVRGYMATVKDKIVGREKLDVCALMTEFNTLRSLPPVQLIWSD